jgi:hypothetical protein
MTGTFPFLKQLGGHNTVKDLAIGIPAALGAAVLGPEILGGLGGLAGAGGEAAAAGTAAFADPTAAALAGTGVGAGAVGAPGAGVAAGFGGTLADAGPFSGLPADLMASTDAAAGAPAFSGDLAGAVAPGDIAGGAVPSIGQFAGVDPTALGSPSWLATPGGGSFTAPDLAAVAPGADAATAAAGGAPVSPWSPFNVGTGAVPFAGATGGVAPAGAAGPGLMDSLGLTGIGNFAKNNAGMLGLLGLSAGAQLLNANKGLPYSQQQLQAAEQAQGIAGQQAKFAKTTEQNLLSGTLPPGAEAAVSKGLQDAIATIKGRYASMGESTMEADAIANAQEQATIQRFIIADQMAQTGVNAISSATQALQLESNVYNGIMNAVLAQDQNLANAVSNFASSAALGTAIGQARAPATP